MTHEFLESLVRTHEAEVFRYVRYLGPISSAEAEDLVQDTFLAAYRSPSPPASQEPRLMAAWLRGIARNLFLSHCRKVRNSPIRTDTASLERAEATWAGEFLREGDGFDYVEALRGCVSKLAQKQKRVLDLYYTDGKSRAELASLCAMTEDGVKSLMRRTRAALAECIRKRVARTAGTPATARVEE